MKENQPWSPVPLAICEACSLVWGIVIVVGAVYLMIEYNWHWTTMILAIFLLACWSCRWCRVPGSEK